METISIREAAERLGVSHKVVRRLVAQGIVSAVKAPGSHGAEWRVEVPSLEVYQADAPVAPAARTLSGPPPGSPEAFRTRQPAHSSQPCPFPPAALGEEALQADKRFLQDQVSSLTALLRAALAGHAGQVPPPSLPTSTNSMGQNGQGVEGDSDPGEPAGPPGFATMPSMIADITAALQSSLRSLGTECVRALEMSSLKVLWGKPVLWRVVAEQPNDVSALVEAILSPEAAWDPPAGEVVFLWARDAAGDVVWGGACGAGWFGAPFQDALRVARVERR